MHVYNILIVIVISSAIVDFYLFYDEPVGMKI